MRRADSEFWQPLRAGGGNEAARAAESLPRWITEHDFKAFTNKTPREFAAEMLKLQEIFHNHQNVVFLQSPPNALDYSEQN
jgi:hypothetical protein